MRVLHLITNLGIGGAETMLVRLLTQLIADGAAPTDHPVAFFRDGPIRYQLEQLGVPVYHLQGSLARYDPILVIRVARLVRCQKPDIIHSSLWIANVIARCVGWWTRVPVICDLHGDCAHHGWLRRALDRIPLPRPAAVVAVSAAVRDSFVRNGGYALRDRTTVITNGIDAGRFAFSPAARTTLRRQLVQDSILVGAVGRLVPIKRYDLLIEAFALFSQDRAVLCLIGDGPLRGYLHGVAKRCGVEDHVRFMGQIDDVAPWYSAFDCLAVTSDSEGMSLALLEALASGLPVLTTGDGDTHEVIITGKNGVVVERGSVEAIAQGLEKLFQAWCAWCAWCGSPVLRPSLLAPEFDLRRSVSAYSKLYKQILGR